MQNKTVTEKMPGVIIISDFQGRHIINEPKPMSIVGDSININKPF